MSKGDIAQAADGELRLGGVIDHGNGAALRQAGQRLIRAATGSTLVLDCSAVERSSSVGLSLLLAFQRDAGAVRKTLAIVNLPDELRQIAQVCGLLEILPIRH